MEEQIDNRVYENHQESSIGHQRQKSFFLEPGPSTNSQYIFDDLYKNQQQKRKFSNNPKYAYFNSLIRMKHKLNPTQDLYSKVFKSPKVGEYESVITGNLPSDNSMQVYGNKTAPSFHIQKLNNHAFKLFKKGGNHYLANESQYNSNTPPIKDISFHIHYQNKSTQNHRDHSKPRLDDIMAEYRRINRVNQQRKDKEIEARKLSVPERTLKLFEKKGISTTFTNPKINMNSSRQSRGFA